MTAVSSNIIIYFFVIPVSVHFSVDVLGRQFIFGFPLACSSSSSLLLS